MISEYHRKALLKVLDEEYGPNGTSGENMATMISHAIGSHQITFREEVLLLEEVMHNRALYMIINYRDKFVARVLIDNGSGLNIYPL